MERIKGGPFSGQKRPNKLKLWLAQRRLSSLQESLQAFDLNSSDEHLNSCEGYHHFSHDKEYGRLGAVALFDGMAVLFTTQAKLSDHSHKFILPDSSIEESSYHMRSINIDAQSLGADPIDLHGIEEIANNRRARAYLNLAAKSLERAAAEGRQIAEPTPGTLRYPPELLSHMSE